MAPESKDESDKASDGIALNSMPHPTLRGAALIGNRLLRFWRLITWPLRARRVVDKFKFGSEQTCPPSSGEISRKRIVIRTKLPEPQWYRVGDKEAIAMIKSASKTIIFEEPD